MSHGSLRLCAVACLSLSTFSLGCATWRVVPKTDAFGRINKWNPSVVRVYRDGSAVEVHRVSATRDTLRGIVNGPKGTMEVHLPIASVDSMEARVHNKTPERIIAGSIVVFAIATLIATSHPMHIP